MSHKSEGRIVLFLLIMLCGSLAAARDYVHEQGTIRTFVPEPEPDAALITFSNGFAIDTRYGEPSLPERYRLDEPLTGKAVRIIQFIGPIRQEWLKELAHKGIETYGYLPHYAVMAGMDAAQCDVARALPTVSWVGIFQPAYKLEEKLLNATGTMKVAIVIAPGGDRKQVEQLIPARGDRLLGTQVSEFGATVYGLVGANTIVALARMQDVIWVQEATEATLCNNLGQWVTQTGYRSVAPPDADTTVARRIWGQRVKGQRVILGVTDTGVNVYNPGHNAFRDSNWVYTAPAIIPQHRKVIAYKLNGSSGGNSSFGEDYYHGSHVCGTVCGDDAYYGGPSWCDGMAIKARLYFVDIERGGGLYVDNDITSLWDTVWTGRGLPDSLRPIKQQSGSWGWGSSTGIYLLQDASTDQFCWKHKDFLNIMAAGNEGSTRTIRNPGIAKNVVTVGALLNGTSSNQIASFSSRGPTADNRIKPTICAPGDGVTAGSGVMSTMASPSTNGYTATGMSGTSMATPMVNGTIGLLRCYLREGYYPSGARNVNDTFGYVSAALLRSMAYASADPNVGSYVIPSYDVGWGRIDADSVLYFTGDSRKLILRDDTVGIATGQYAEQTFIVNSSIPLRIALAWTDTAGAVNANPALVNDLNLEVLAPGGAPYYRGNQYTSGQSTQNPAAWDNRNVEECARVNNPTTGTWTLRVRGLQVVTAKQPFAWTITGDVSLQQADVGCTRILAPAGTIDSTLSVAPACSVYNFGSTTETYNVRMKVGSGYYNSTVQVPSHAPATKRYVTFPANAAWPRGNGQAVSCSTELASDIARNNDKATGTVNVRVLDAEALSITAPTGTVDSGASPAPQASVRNNGTASATFDVRCDIGTYTSIKNVTVPAGLSQVVDFDPWPATRRDTNTISVTTLLASDMVPGNNQKTAKVFVRVLDAEALAITAPVGTVDSGASIPPQANVRNNGNTAVDFPVTFTITGGYSNTQPVTGLARGATQLVDFAAWAALPRGSLTTSAATGLANDMVPGNNTAAGSVDVQVKDVGCQMLLAPSGSYDSAATAVPACSVYNYGTVAASYDVRMKIGAQYENTVSVAGHQPLTAQYLTFPLWTANERGGLAVSCSTEYALDQVAADDKQAGTVFVQTVDVGATSILAPTGVVDSNAVVTPSAVIHNFGNTEQTFDIEFTVDDGYTNTIARTVGPGADSTFSFADWTAGVRGTHVVKCSTRLATDVIPANDLATGSVDVAVHDVGAVGIVAPSGVIPPGTVTPQATVHNYGTTREGVDVFFTIDCTPPYEQIVNLLGGLPQGVDTVIGFLDWTAATGSYVARCSTAMASDQAPGNDVAVDGFSVGRIDVGVTGITGPTGDIDSSALIVPSATVKNFGDFAASFKAFFWFDTAGGNAYSDSVAVSDLSASKESTVVFREWAKPHLPQTYVTRCSTWIAGDANTANDTLGGSFRITLIPLIAGWTPKADVPIGGRNKKVKDGGSLAYFGPSGRSDLSDTSYIYALKGNNRCEFYQYNTSANTWATKESIPPIGRAGKKKMVKKGASLAQADGRLYATKGNNTLEFWQYDPSAADAYPWSQKADVPMGVKNVKEGTGAVAVQIGDTNYVYFLKGSGTQEFYRYNALTNAWETKATAPAGLSGKMFKNGSCLAYDGENTVYALKGSYNEFFAYQVDSNVWTTKAGLPLIGSSGRKKKVKDGAGIAYLSGNWGLSQGFRPTKSGTVPEFARSAGCLYALKGGNTQEFWKYVADSDRWVQKEDMPLGGGKRVKGGGALVAAGEKLFALKGNNTLEFWQYTPGAADGLQLAANSPNTLSNSSLVTRLSALTVAPNPFSGTATISYSLPNAGNISLKLYDVTGTLVSTLTSGYHNAGASSFIVHRSSFARGIYVLRLEWADQATTRKLIIE
jgi:hypothetical protein